MFNVANICSKMSLTSIFVIIFIFPLVTSLSTHLLCVHIRVLNTSVETLINKNQFDSIEIQLKQKHIPYHQIQDNKNRIKIIIGPLTKLINLKLIMIMFNQTRFYMKYFPMTVDEHEYNRVYDQESYEFRSCLELCEIFQDNELKPDHNCIRKKCLKEIMGI